MQIFCLSDILDYSIKSTSIGFKHVKICLIFNVIKTSNLHISSSYFDTEFE